MAPRARNNRQAPGEPQLSPVWTETRPLLTPALMARLCAYGSAETVCAGDLIYQLGDCSYDLILIESGRVDLLCEPSTAQPPLPIAEMGPGDFLGELSLFTGERMFITACAREAGTIYRIGAEAFRQLMSHDAELSDVILTALYRRRGILKSALADTIDSRPTQFGRSDGARDVCRTNGVSPPIHRREIVAGSSIAHKPRPAAR